MGDPNGDWIDELAAQLTHVRSGFVAEVIQHNATVCCFYLGPSSTTSRKKADIHLIGAVPA